MELAQVNYLAVLVCGVVIFMLGGLWYSPVMFAKPWMRLIGKSEEELKAGSGPAPLMFLLAFVCGLISAWTLAVILSHYPALTALRGAMTGALCWLGFTGATSFITGLFSSKPKMLWLIDSTYYLVSFVIAGAILAAWT